VGVQKILDDPIGSLKTNLHGSENVIQACSESKVDLVLASTSEIYGKNPTQPLTEDSDRVIGSPLLSRWTYSEAKAIDEALAHAYHSKHGLKVKIVRLFNTVGPRQSPAYGMVIPRFFAAALSGKDLEIHGDGSQRRVFCHVDDAVSGVIELWRHSDGNGEAFNIGGIEEISILNLAKKIIEVTKSNSKINYIPYANLKSQGFEDMQRRVPSTEKLKKLTGWSPKKGLDEILFDYLFSVRK
jgi:UDP-glucose 4-epimerase